MPTKFYVIRHGLTDWNKQSLIQGHKDIDLCDEGIAQARELAQVFSNFHLDRVVSSDLLRAKHTAKIVMNERILPLETTIALRERFWGVWEGHYLKELQDKFAESDLQNIIDATLPELGDVETYESAQARVIPYLLELVKMHAGESILVVTHYGILKTLLLHFGFRSEIHIPNISYLEIVGQGEELILLNSCRKIGKLL